MGVYLKCSVRKGMSTFAGALIFEVGGEAWICNCCDAMMCEETRLFVDVNLRLDLCLSYSVMPQATTTLFRGRLKLIGNSSVRCYSVLDFRVS